MYIIYTKHCSCRILSPEARPLQLPKEFRRTRFTRHCGRGEPSSAKPHSEPELLGCFTSPLSAHHPASPSQHGITHPSAQTSARGPSAVSLVGQHPHT